MERRDPSGLKILSAHNQIHESDRRQDWDSKALFRATMSSGVPFVMKFSVVREFLQGIRLLMVANIVNTLSGSFFCSVALGCPTIGRSLPFAPSRHYSSAHSDVGRAEQTVSSLQSPNPCASVLYEEPPVFPLNSTDPL